VPSSKKVILRMDSRLADLSANLEHFVGVFAEAEKFSGSGLHFLHKILACLHTPSSVVGRTNIY